MGKPTAHRAESDIPPEGLTIRALSAVGCQHALQTARVDCNRHESRPAIQLCHDSQLQQQTAALHRLSGRSAWGTGICKQVWAPFVHQGCAATPLQGQPQPQVVLAAGDGAALALGHAPKSSALVSTTAKQVSLTSSITAFYGQGISSVAAERLLLGFWWQPGFGCVVVAKLDGRQGLAVLWKHATSNRIILPTLYLNSLFDRLRGAGSGTSGPVFALALLPQFVPQRKLDIWSVASQA